MEFRIQAVAGRLNTIDNEWVYYDRKGNIVKTVPRVHTNQ